MTPEQRDAAVEHERDNREFTRLMEQLSHALSNCDHHTRTGDAFRLIETAQRAVDAWQAMA